LFILFAAAEEPSNKEIVMVPEEMQGPEIFAPQYSKERYLLSTYNPSTQLLKVINIMMCLNAAIKFTSFQIYPAGTDEEKLLYVHKLPPDGKPLMYADRFILLTNSSDDCLIISSCQLSEVKSDLVSFLFY